MKKLLRLLVLGAGLAPAAALAQSYPQGGMLCGGAIQCDPSVTALDNIIMKNNHFDINGTSVSANCGTIIAGSNDFRGTVTGCGASITINFGAAYTSGAGNPGAGFSAGSVPVCGVLGSTATISAVYGSSFTVVNSNGSLSWLCLGK